MELAYIKPTDEEGIFEIRLFENQRFRFFRGWGYPSDNSSDPSHISYVDGPSSTFPNLSSVECAPGWRWKPGSDWTIDMNYTRTNSSGWCYATSFLRMNTKLRQNISSPSPTFRQFVRRRVWSRLLEKNIPNLDGMYGTCLHGVCISLINRACNMLYVPWYR